MSILDEPRHATAQETPGTRGGSGQAERKDLRVFLADDHAVVREGLRTLIDAQPDMAVVGEADDGMTAFERISALQPDVAVLDVSMPRWNGAEVTARLRAAVPDVKILALTMHEDKSYLRSLLDAGTSGYVLKRSAAEELIRAIRAVSAGEKYLDPSLSTAIVDTLYGRGGRATALRGDAEGSSLSEREEEVLRLIAQGYTNKEIGTNLFLSVKTVETYKARSMEKLGLTSRADIVRHALAQGWLKNTS